MQHKKPRSIVSTEKYRTRGQPFSLFQDKLSGWEKFDKGCELAWNALGNNFGRLTILGLAALGLYYLLLHR
ncbi:MAG: hypothetical protein WBL63_09745 [Candidatus Acidiferrum sp.]